MLGGFRADSMALTTIASQGDGASILGSARLVFSSIMRVSTCRRAIPN